MEVHVVGDDPVREAVVAALGDVDLDVRDGTPEGLESARFGVVSGLAGADTFERANRAALAGSTPWIAIEVGGVGGRPLEDLDAAVSGFAPRTGCFECLRTRVTATTDDGDGADEPSADRSAVRLAGAIGGREAVRVLSGDDRTVLGGVLEVPHARRRFLPVPGCECDEGGRKRTLERDDDALELEAAVERAETVIDDRVGLVTSIGEIHSFPAPYYLATTADTSGFSDASAPTEAAGVDTDWNAALMKAVGEALERYCGAVYREDDFVHASEDALESAVPPTAFVRPDDAPSFDPAAEHRWVPGENLATGAEVHLPAAAVQFPQPGERLVPAITTGLGLGSSTVDALLAGLTEVLERDATMLAWYSTYEPLALSISDDGYETLERRARSEGLDVTPLLVTQDVDVPVVAVAVHRDLEDGTAPLEDGEFGNPACNGEVPEDWPRFAVGSAADLDADSAARSALAEALQNWMELRAVGPEAATQQSGAIGEYASFPEAARAFVDAEASVPGATVGPDPIPTGGDALEALVDRVRDVGLTPYAARLTTRDVEQAGFEAVRVVVPGAQPLFTGDAYFGERAETVPTDLGFEPALERDYHPYP